MKTLYFECQMGAAGDMLMAALLELIPDRQAFLDRLNKLGIPGTTISEEASVKCGISGTHINVSIGGQEEESHDHHHHHDHHHPSSFTFHSSPPGHSSGTHAHAGLADIETLINALDLPVKVRSDVFAVYNLIAEAESQIHNKPVREIHFHEVGMLDALADIVGVCLLMDQLAPDQVLASPIHVGSGQVHCAHGILPVPAPATAYILRGVPTYGGSIRGELCTPTGAALLRHFVGSFGDQPVMAVSQIGYGMGKKDFAAANCVRALLGDTQDTGDRVAELCCNLDDMTPEAIAFAQERLLEAGALDVFTTPIGMKKSRPGILFSCLCRPDQSENMARLIFQYTRTLGIRRYDCQRCTLTRSEQVLETTYGSVRIKNAAGWGVQRSKAEYEDVAKIARQTGMSVDDARRLIEQGTQHAEVKHES